MDDLVEFKAEIADVQAHFVTYARKPGRVSGIAKGVISDLEDAIGQINLLLDSPL